MNVVISGTAFTVPEGIVSNKDVVKRINTSEQFILERTGVQTRRHVTEDQSLKSLMVPCCAQAISSAGLDPKDIDMLIVNTLSPDHHDPSQACLIQPLLHLRDIPVMDIRAQCSGLIYGVDIARQFILSRKCKHILVACGEILSKRMDHSDEGRNLSILLGDGAGAVVLSACEESSYGIIDLLTGADGSYYKLLWTESPGSANKIFNGDKNACTEFRMNGRPMFDHAVEKITAVCRQILQRNHLLLSDIDIIIPHQPNLRILDAVRERLSIPESKMWINVYKYGNMASACLPIALSEYMQSTVNLTNKLCLILGYGSGATWGAILYKFQ
jgi:3-oxoacyl-(acyl-carrier-protein) synthase III